MLEGIYRICVKLIKKTKQSQHVTSYWTWKHIRILTDYGQKSPSTLLESVLLAEMAIQNHFLGHL